MSTPSIFPPGSDDEFAVSADEDLRAAVDSATSNARATSETPREPIGFTWWFDFRTGRFRRRGDAPAMAHRRDAVAQWCMLAVRVERFSCPAVLPDEYGIERLDDPVGHLVDNAALRDLEARVRDCLLVHDRITAVRDFQASYDPDVISMSMSIVLDGADVFAFDARVPNASFGGG